MKKDTSVPKSASERQTRTTDKSELREDPSNTDHNNLHPPHNKDADHDYPKDERRWPENKVPTK